MFTEPKDLVKVLKDLIKKEIDDRKLGVSIWQVTDTKSRGSDGYATDFKCNIKHTNFKLTYDDVPIAGIGLGHGKGIIRHPEVGDFVLVAFIDEEPFILGTVFDYFTNSPDSVPVIKLGEMIFVAREKGSLILFKDNNDVVIRIADASGNIDNGARFRLNSDGSFKLFGKGNFGIECDASGNLVLRGITIDHQNTGGTF
jgi:hypothetical protein